MTAALTATTRLAAATNGFVAPTFRGAVNSQSGYWETSANLVGADGNHPDQPGATAIAVLMQTNAGAAVTGGNIYNQVTNNAFVIADVPSFAPPTVALQTRTLCNPLDCRSLTLNY